MRLYVCWGLFRTPKPGHPCRNAYDALVAAGWAPEVVRCYGWGLLPTTLNRSKGRRRVRELTGRNWVPVLETGDETIPGSKRISAWADANPAPVLDEPRARLALRATSASDGRAARTCASVSL